MRKWQILHCLDRKVSMLLILIKVKNENCFFKKKNYQIELF